MNGSFDNVQRIVLHGYAWKQCRHLVLSFPERSRPLGFLQSLKKSAHWPTSSGAERPHIQLSLGFSRRGLEQAFVPPYVLAIFAMKSPAFMAGAAVRASSQLGAKGSDAPESWVGAFGFLTLDAVLSVHAQEKDGADNPVAAINELANAYGVKVTELPKGSSLPKPPGVVVPPWSPDWSPTWDPHWGHEPEPQWTHFGYRDGLSRVGIEGHTKQKKLATYKPISIHPAGEFVLGHPQSGGANPWISGPGSRVWPDEIRTFFANGSFGVLHQVEQHVKEFEQFVNDKAQVLDMNPEALKAKLCGRQTNGLPLAAKNGAGPTADFDYTLDQKGYACPFGSHMRRMNPRGDSLAHEARQRPLLRRGMPYGPDWYATPDDDTARGLLGHFFCASIEDQFEHLIGQWADRVPLGSKDRGRARDPLIGAHEGGDGDFFINRAPLLAPLQPREPLRLRGLKAFTSTRGTAYLFYPSLHTLEGIANNSMWRPSADDEEDA
jgi:hypothetical protein